MPDDFQDRYEIISRIGAGGVGAVYKAKDTRLGRMVAVKRLLPPDETEDQAKLGSDLIKEARALSAFQHPNIITVFDYGEDEDGLYIIMELLEGDTVEELAKDTQLQVDTLTELAEQCLEGLSVAHERNLLHRDLKPSNIFVTQVTGGEAKVKLLDFGLAKFSSQPALQTVDQSRSILGSIYFMAPEQFVRKPLDARCDLYQLGCVFFYALTSEYAYDGETTAAVMDAHLDHTPKDLAKLRPDVPEEFRDWVMSLIALEPSDRPETAAKALQELRIVAQKLGLPAQPPREDAPPTGQVVVQTATAEVAMSATNAYLQKQQEVAEKKIAAKAVAEKQISTPVWIAGIAVLALAFIGVIVFALKGKDDDEQIGTTGDAIGSATVPISKTTIPAQSLPPEVNLELELDASKGLLSGSGGIETEPSKIGDSIASWVDQAPFGGESRPSYVLKKSAARRTFQPTASEAILLPGKPARPAVRFTKGNLLFLQSRHNGGTDLSETVNKDGAASIFVLVSPADDEARRGVLSWIVGRAEVPLFCLYTSGSEIGFGKQIDMKVSATDFISISKSSGPVLFELGIAKNRTSIRITNWGSNGEILGEAETEFSEPVLFETDLRIGGPKHGDQQSESDPEALKLFTGDIFGIRVLSGDEATFDQRRQQAQAMWNG